MKYIAEKIDILLAHKCTRIFGCSSKEWCCMRYKSLSSCIKNDKFRQCNINVMEQNTQLAAIFAVDRDFLRK